MIKTYRYMILLMLVLHGLWFFVPWFSFFDPESLDAMYWSGYGASLDIKIIFYLMMASGWLFFIVYIGLYFFSRLARGFHVLLVLIMPVLSLAYGLSVVSPIEMMFINMLGVCDGFVIAIGFFTSVSKKFENS